MILTATLQDQREGHQAQEGEESCPRSHSRTCLYYRHCLFSRMPVPRSPALPSPTEEAGLCSGRDCGLWDKLFWGHSQGEGAKRCNTSPHQAQETPAELTASPLSFCRRLTGGLPCGMPHAPRGVRLAETCRTPSRQSLAWPLGLSEFEVFHPPCCLLVIHPELFPQRSLMLVSLPL